jgi:hypothetical protein
LLIPNLSLVFASEKLSISLDKSSETGTQTVYFSDQKHEIPLILKGMDHCVNIVATLLQLTTRLSAEITQQQLVECQHFTTKSDPSPINLKFAFQTPKIKREAPFKWQFEVCTKTNDCQSIGEYYFSVIPRNILEPIVQWSKNNTIYIHDKSGVLQNFFDKKSIQYLTSKHLLPKNQALISLIVIAKENININKLLPTNQTGLVILFREYLSEYPIIVDKTNRHPPLLDVHIPLIAKLENHAATQKLFVKLFTLLPETIASQ